MSQTIIPVSLGELIDKITILEIKSERITDPDKLSNVRLELDQLQKVSVLDQDFLNRMHKLRASLKAVNQDLWDIEDKIRVKESLAEFDKEFVELARAVYFRNDERAAFKRMISVEYGDGLIEEKSYFSYSPDALVNHPG